MKKIKVIENKINLVSSIIKEYEEISELINLAEKENENDLLKDLETQLEELISRCKKYKIETMFNNKTDFIDCFLDPIFSPLYYPFNLAFNPFLLLFPNHTFLQSILFPFFFLLSKKIFGVNLPNFFDYLLFLVLQLFLYLNNQNLDKSLYCL